MLRHVFHFKIVSSHSLNIDGISFVNAYTWDATIKWAYYHNNITNKAYIRLVSSSYTSYYFDDLKKVYDADVTVADTSIHVLYNCADM